VKSGGAVSTATFAQLQTRAGLGLTSSIGPQSGDKFALPLESAWRSQRVAGGF
jgi:hypothetical protein